MRIEITKYTSPCNSITASFLHGDYPRISQKVHPGYSRVYARVLRSGKFVVGQLARVVNGATVGLKDY